MECIREETVCCNKAIKRIELYEGCIEDALIDSLENPYRFQRTNYLAKKDELLDAHETLHLTTEIYQNVLTNIRRNELNIMEMESYVHDCLVTAKVLKEDRRMEINSIHERINALIGCDNRELVQNLEILQDKAQQLLEYDTSRDGEITTYNEILHIIDNNKNKGDK